MMGPHAIYTTDREYLELVMEKAQEYGLGINIHLSESRKEVDDCYAQHGCSPVEYLDNMGMFSFHTVAAHCVQLSDKDIEVTLSATLKEGYGYSSAGAMAQWLFEADEEGDFLREDSQTKAYYNENGGVYGVCFIVSAPSLNESIIKDSRHILFRVNNEGGMTDEEAKKKAEELLATLNEGGLTEEEFAEAAKEHSTDYGSAPKGGLIEGAAKESLYEEYGDWLFAEDRKTGDVGLVKTEVGYHLVFCVSENVKWKEDVESALRGREFNEAYEEYRKAYAIKVNEPCLTTIESA